MLRGLDPGKLLEAIYVGYSKHPSLKIRIVADLVRNFGPENEMLVLERIKELRPHGLVGIGLGGSEQNFPAELFSEGLLLKKPKNMVLKRPPMQESLLVLKVYGRQLSNLTLIA